MRFFQAPAGAQGVSAPFAGGRPCGPCTMRRGIAHMMAWARHPILESAGMSSWRCASLGGGQHAAAADHSSSGGGDQGGEAAAAGSTASDMGLFDNPPQPAPPPAAQAPRPASSGRRQRRAGTVLLDQGREGSPRRRSRGTQILDQLSTPPASAAVAGGAAAATPQRRRRASQRTASAAIEAAAPLHPSQEPAPQLPTDGFLPGRGQHVLMATAVLEPAVAAAATTGPDVPDAADQQLQAEPRARRQGRRRSMQFGFDPTVDLLGLEGMGPATAADEAALREHQEHEQRQEQQRLQLEQQLQQQVEKEQQQVQQVAEQQSLQWQEQQHVQQQNYQGAAPAAVPAVQQPQKVQRRGRKVSRTVVVPADAAVAPPAPAPPPPPPLPITYPPLASAYHNQRPSSRSTTSSSRRQTEASLVSELTEALWEEDIRVENARFDHSQRMVCPKCGGGSSRELSLSVTLKRSGCAVWNCFRATCGHSGAVYAPGGPAQEAGGGDSSGGSLAVHASASAPRVGRPRVQRPDTSQLRPLSPDLIAWFGARGISPATLAANGVAMEHRFVPGAAASGGGARVPAIAFPYSRAGEVVNIKYRALPKAWSQTKGGEQILYGIDDVTGREEVIIVEGELDKLALYEAGITHAASVPSGAVAPKRTATAAGPATMPDPAAISAAAAAAAAAADRRAGSKFAFLRRAEPALAAAARIIIATDADAPGQALAEELARRLGRGRCLLLMWPAGCKDANDALLALGREGLAQWVRTAAVPMPPP